MTGNPELDSLITNLILAAITGLAGYLIRFLYKWKQDREAYRKAREKEDAQERKDMREHMERVDVKLDRMLDAQQISMRSDIVHKSEKYISRGWLTPEEHLTLSQEYGSYDGLGLNGFIKTYMDKVDELEIRRI